MEKRNVGGLCAHEKKLSGAAARTGTVSRKKK